MRCSAVSIVSTFLSALGLLAQAQPAFAQTGTAAAQSLSRTPIAAILMKDSVFDKLGAGIAEVTGLKGAIQKSARGATHEALAELTKFIDQNLDPLLERAQEVLDGRITHAANQALRLIQELETTAGRILEKATENAQELTARFFKEFDSRLHTTLGALDRAVDKVVCAVAPMDTVHIGIGPWKAYSIRVWRPKKTECYWKFLTLKPDPLWWKFEGSEYFEGELCEYELALGRIEIDVAQSVTKLAAAYSKLASYAKAARCTANDDALRGAMSLKHAQYKRLAALFRRLQANSFD